MKLQTLKEALDHNCPTCEQCPAEPDHECPFRVEIYDNHKDLCNCCYDCQQNCAMEV